MGFGLGGGGGSDQKVSQKCGVPAQMKAGNFGRIGV